MNDPAKNIETPTPQKNTDVGKWESYAQFVKWAAERSRLELQELDKYISEKIQELVARFQAVAQDAAEQNEKVRSAKNKEEMITIRGEILSYPKAVEELYRLVGALSTGTVPTDDQVLTRRKISILTKALYGFAEKQEKLTETTAHASQNIKTNVKDIIITFQFQDFVKQRLDHIDFVLESITEHAKALQGDDSRTDVPEDLAKSLLDKFFLSRVKENFVNGLDESLAASIDITIEEDDDGIELF